MLACTLIQAHNRYLPLVPGIEQTAWSRGAAATKVGKREPHRRTTSVVIEEAAVKS